MKTRIRDGILLDLGLSSIQLEKEERGFSFRGEGPLDMRMDQRMDETAADLVNNLSSEELEEILFQYGEERWAKQNCQSHRAGKRTGTHRDDPGFKKDRPPCHPKTIPFAEN